VAGILSAVVQHNTNMDALLAKEFVVDDKIGLAITTNKNDTL
jgi:hypothetical protein